MPAILLKLTKNLQTFFEKQDGVVYKGIALLASPLLLGAAFWIENLWFLVFIAFVPFFFAIARLSKRRAFIDSLFFVTVTFIILNPLLQFRSVQAVVPGNKIFYVVAIIIFIYGITMSLVATLALWLPFSFLKSPWRILGISVGWTIFELLKTKMSFGLQWIFMGEPLIAFTPLAIFARWGGSEALSFLVMASNIAIYEMLMEAKKSKTAILKRQFTTIAGVFIALISIGIFLLNVSKEQYKEELDIAVVQPGSFYGTPAKQYFRSLRERTQLISQEHNLEGAQLIILPANHANTLARTQVNRELVRQILSFDPKEATVILGFYLSEKGKKYQALASIPPSGPAQITFKEKLLPIADFMPAPLAYFLPSHGSTSGNLSPRKGELITLPSGKAIGVISCSEEFVPRISAKFKKNGSKLIIISGSTDDFSGKNAYKEVLRAARFRALENNTYVVLAMKSGISAIIDPQGKVISSLSEGEIGVLRMRVPLGN